MFGLILWNNTDVEFDNDVMFTPTWQVRVAIRSEDVSLLTVVSELMLLTGYRFSNGS